MKKGFTLIELLAVITLLGFLSLIVVPVVDKIIKDSEQDLYETQINNIEQAAKNWSSENIFLFHRFHQPRLFSKHFFNAVFINCFIQKIITFAPVFFLRFFLCFYRSVVYFFSKSESSTFFSSI